MRRVVICALSVALFCASVVTADEPAPRPPLNKSPGGVDSSVARRVDPQLFLIYLLENFYRDTFRPSGQPRYAGSDLNQFLRLRETRVDKVINHLINTKAPDDLRASYESYRRLLTSMKQLDQELRTMEEEYYKPVREIYATAGRQIRANRQAANLRAAATGAEYTLREFRRGASVEDGLTYGAAAGVADRVRQEPQLQAESKQIVDAARKGERDYHASNWKPYRDKVADKLDQFAKQHKQARDDAAGAVNRLARRMARQAKWDAGEADFNPTRDPAVVSPTVRPRDPFRAYWLARQANASDAPAPSDRATIEQAHGLAKDCLASAALVPSDAPFKFVKVMIAYEAGRLANRAAEAEAGQGGFATSPGKRAYSPARTAIEAWKTVGRLETANLQQSEEVLHQTVRAYAYARELDHANRLIALYMTNLRRGRQLPLSRPETWYDFARICALGKTHATGSRLADPANALDCLLMAVLTGTKQAADARVQPDFDSLRHSKSKVVQTRFETILILAEGGRVPTRRGTVPRR